MCPHGENLSTVHCATHAIVIQSTFAQFNPLLGISLLEIFVSMKLGPATGANGRNMLLHGIRKGG